MRTKKRDAAKVGNLPGFKQTVDEFADSEMQRDAELEATQSKRERFQLSFDLNEDGTPDLTSMRGRTKEKVQAFFSDPRMASAFGASRPATPEVQVFHPAMVAGMYAVIGSIETMVAINMGKIPPLIAKQVFTYTPAEIEALTGPTTRVLNKYAAEWMIRYQDEIALATLLTSMTIMKVNTAIMLAKMANGSTPQTSSQVKSEEEGKKDGLVQ